MISKFFGKIILLISIAVLLAVQTPAGAEILQDNYEFDNTMDYANLIEVHELQNHTIHNETDVDWLEFTAEAGVTYSISTTEDICVEVILFESDGYTLIERGGCMDVEEVPEVELMEATEQPTEPTQDPAPVAYRHTIEWKCPASGTYLIRVTAEEVGEYSIMLSPQ
jgi:hypothetical protein